MAKTLFQFTEGNAPALTDYCLTGQDPGGSPAMRRLTWASIRNLFIGAPTAINDFIVSLDGSTWSKRTAAQTQAILGVSLAPPNGRLTLETGVPVSTTDQADKTTLYYTPYNGNMVPLYNGTSAWTTLTFSELSLDISGFTASKPYDIWIYNNSGTAALDSTVWTNATTRATALAYQDGRLVKAGATTRLYLGTIYMDSASKCQDTLLLRYVWNYYNRTNRVLKVTEATDSWSYTTATWRSANNSTANRVTVIIGVNEDPLDLTVTCYAENATTTAGRLVGICVDNTNANNSNVSASVKAPGGNSWSKYVSNPGIGYHFFQWTEYSDAAGGTTWYGDAGIPTVLQSGMVGSIRG